MRHLAGVVQKPVDFRNYHHCARGYLRFRNKLPWNSIRDPSQRLRLIELAIKARRDAGMRDATLDRPSRFFDEKFKWIQGHGIGKLQGATLTSSARGAPRDSGEPSGPYNSLLESTVTLAKRSICYTRLPRNDLLTSGQQSRARPDGSNACSDGVSPP